MNLMIRFFAVFCTLLLYCTVNAQNFIVKGIVLDENDDPIIGAYILSEGSDKGVISDLDGRFSLETTEGQTLLVSYLGYEDMLVKASSKEKLMYVRMSPSKNELDEVVITGYSSMAKKDLAGAISVIKVDDANERVGSSAASFLQGKIAGLHIVQNTGAPGTAASISIRGANSITGNNQPLIVIDGVPMENDYVNPGAPSDFGYYLNQPPTDILSTINMNEIESVQVMKDASSTAIYGSRAANGVILITTKQGNAGKPKITVDSRLDVSFKPEGIKMLSTSDYFNYLDEASYNTRGVFFTGESELPLEFRATAPNTDWQNEIYKASFSHDHNINISGGKKNDRYSIFLGLTDAKGSLQKSDYNRLSVRFNNSKQFSERLTLRFNTSASYTTNSRTPQGPGMASVHSTVLNAIVSRPYISPYDDEGDIDSSTVGVGNPLAILKGTDDITSIVRFDLNTFLDYKITKWLSLNYQLSGGYMTQTRDAYWGLDTAFGKSTGNTALYSPVSAYNYRSVVTAVVNHRWNNRHRFNAVLGYEWAYWNNRSTTIVSRNFPNDSFKSDNLGAATSQIPTTSSRNIRAMSSVVMRATYSYDNRYSATFTGRLDGSSLLAPGNRYSFFPSIGFVWNVEQEHFFQRFKDYVNSFKIRGSYGITGNQSVSNGAYLSQFNSTMVSLATGQWIPAFTHSTFSNPDLSWEKTYQFNIGFDMAFLDNRITLTLDWYKKNTLDLLINKSIPTSNGFASFWDNDGEVLNTGLEVEFGADVIRKKDFTWNISYNFSMNRNEVIRLGSSGFMGTKYNFSASGTPVSISIAKEGYPIGAFWGYTFDGIYQNLSEVASGPTINGKTMTPGDMRYSNLSNDENSINDINSADQSVIGSPYPVFTMGLTNEFRYKGLSLSFLIDCNYGQKVANLNRAYTDGLIVITSMANGANTYNVSERAYYNRWRGEGTSNYFPKPRMGTANMDGMFSDFLLEDASFVKLRYITLAYTFRFKKVLNSLKLFVTGTNLITLTNYSGYDPEVNGTGHSAINQGIDLGCMPMVKSCSLGISFGF